MCTESCADSGMSVCGEWKEDFLQQSLDAAKKKLEKMRVYKEAAGPVTCSLQVWPPLIV